MNPVFATAALSIAFYSTLAVCCTACVLFLWIFIRALTLNGTPTFEVFSTEWRGLGGGLGGVRVSVAFTTFVLSAIFGLLSVTLVTQQIHAQRESESEERRYQDARRAGEVELEKARIAAAKAAAPATSAISPSTTDRH